MKVILEETLRKQNMSQYYLAKITGISVANLNRLCNNKTKSISFEMLDKLCDALDCEIDEILQRGQKDT